MVPHSRRPLTGSSSRYSGSAMSGPGSAGGTLRMLGRRRMTKFRFRMLIVIYLALGCIIPYYVMKRAEQEELSRQRQLQSEDNPRDYRRRPFFEDLVEEEVSITDSPPGDDQQRDEYSGDSILLEGTVPLLSGSIQHTPEPRSSHPTADHIQYQMETHVEVLEAITRKLKYYRILSNIRRVRAAEDYEKIMEDALSGSREWVQNKMPEEFRWMGERERIPGTKLDTAQKARRFRALMDQALNAGRWVYEPHRDYPDFGGATGWNKKKLNERDRDVAIDRPPFPEAGKYHWEPLAESDSQSTESTPQERPLGELPSAPSTLRPGWHANRIPPEDFCEILGPRHIVLVGDLIHWQLHDSIMYNMFDNPQACYGDLACHIGVGHPLCPLPDDVRLKFVRNDLLSPVRLRKIKSNETKTHNPVEMPWLKDMRLKDTVILGATHHNLRDYQFQRRLTETVTKIRMARPEALIIYRNNPVGHPGCPSRANGYNNEKIQRLQREVEKVQKQKLQRKQLKKQLKKQLQLSGAEVDVILKGMLPPKKKRRQRAKFLRHDNSTFEAAPKPFDQGIPFSELLDYPSNWVDYDRQNQMAKIIVEAAGGIYWNVATMTNMRPDGHVGGQDCLSYKRPGPTDEWAVSLYNLFKTIHQVEQEATTA